MPWLPSSLQQSPTLHGNLPHQPSPWVGPGKPNLPLGLRGKAGGGARVTAPPSSRAEGLLFLHGLESNPGSSLQTEEEAGLP